MSSLSPRIVLVEIDYFVYVTLHVKVIMSYLKAVPLKALSGQVWNRFSRFFLNCGFSAEVACEFIAFMKQ